MRKSYLFRRNHGAGFTLVELLVVIGIIAVLVGILLPALNKARRQAQQTQCASNMRQIAAAVLTYINDNSGAFPPAMISDNYGSTTDSTNPYKDGWFWAAELMNQHYLAAPNTLAGFPSQSTGTGTEVTPNFGNAASVFYCPAALSSADATPGAGTSASSQGLYPMDTKNSIGVYGEAVAPRGDGGIPYATTTWYELSLVNGTPSSGGKPSPQVFPGGVLSAPFIFFDVTSTKSSGAPKLGGPTGQLASADFRRRLSQVKHSAVMAMVVEATGVNWMFSGKSSANTATKGPTASTVGGFWMPCMAARHGLATKDGYNAYSNIAFFDGHVDTFATLPFQTYVAPSPTNWGGAAVIPQSMGAVFTLNQDQ